LTIQNNFAHVINHLDLPCKLKILIDVTILNVLIDCVQKYFRLLIHHHYNQLAKRRERLR